MMLENENNNLNDDLEGVLNLMNNLPDGTIKVLNPAKYQSMLRSVFLLKDILSETQTSIEIMVDIEERFNAGVVSVELDELTILSPKKFADLLHSINNMEVYPLVNGKIRLSFAFHNILKTIE